MRRFALPALKQHGGKPRAHTSTVGQYSMHRVVGLSLSAIAVDGEFAVMTYRYCRRWGLHAEGVLGDA